MQAWNGGGRGRGEAVTDTPRADWLASRAGNAHLVRGGIFGEADIPIDAEDLCRFVVSEAPAPSRIGPAGSMQRTTYNILDRQLGNRVVNLNESLG